MINIHPWFPEDLNSVTHERRHPHLHHNILFISTHTTSLIWSVTRRRGSVGNAARPDLLLQPGASVTIPYLAVPQTGISSLSALFFSRSPLSGGLLWITSSLRQRRAVLSLPMTGQLIEAMDMKGYEGEGDFSQVAIEDVPDNELINEKVGTGIDAKDMV